MKKTIDEFELSFPLNIWNKILYENIEKFQLDIYYNETGFPPKIHDLGKAEIDKFRLVFINEVCNRNNTDEVWRVSSDAFAVMAKRTNCGNFKIEYREVIFNILKKTVLITVCPQGDAADAAWCLP